MKVSVKIRGVDISEYTVVYPANYTDEQADDIKKLFGSLSKALDENIAVCSQAAPDKNIYIGHGFDDDRSQLGTLDYVKRMVDSDIYLYGNGFWGDIKAVYSFVRCDIGLDYSGELIRPITDIIDLNVVYKYKKPIIDIAGTCNMGHLFTGEEQFFVLLKEGGINRITINILNITVPDKLTMHEFMVLLTVYEIRVLWFDNAVKERPAESMDYHAPVGSEYFHACLECPMTVGHYIWDEPGIDMFAAAARAAAGYKAAHPDKVAFVNMLPYYAAPVAFDFKGIEHYTEEFMKVIKPEEAWFDIYPFHDDGTTKDRYVDNTAIVADAALRYGVHFGVYIQSTAFANCRYPTGRDLSLQLWLCLAFGARLIELFTYTTYMEGGPESFGLALIDKDRNPTPTYYDGQRVIADIRYFEGIYGGYRFLGAFSKNCNEGEWNYHKQQYKDFSAIKLVDASAPVLVGCFEGENGKKAFCAVNVSDVTEDADKAINVSFKTDSDVLVYQACKCTHLCADAEGIVTLTLNTAEGAFVEIFESK